MKLLAVLALVAALSPACASDLARLGGVDPAAESSIATVHTAVGESFRLRLGEVADVKGTTLLIGFREVANDSRCPVNVQCISAGNAAVTIGAISGQRPWSWIRLHTGAEPRQLRSDGYTVALVGLEPSARQGEQIPLGDYIAVLRVTRE